MVTAGSPYWGAPTPWLALSHGWISDFSNPLDAISFNHQIRALAVNLTGGYSLFPSRRRGPT